MKLNSKLFIVIVLFLIIGGSSYLFYREGTLPVNATAPTVKIFVIAKGESLSTIAKHLVNEDLIRNKIVFYLIVKQMGLDKNIQAGDFRLSTAMNAYQIAKALTHGTLDVWITLIEGLRKEEVAQIISANLDIPESEIISRAKEGYLFPDTYLVPRDATAGAVLAILSANFSKRVTGQLQQEIRKKGLTIDQALTLASLVEKEARYEKDRPLVASILFKRFKNDWALQSDAAVQYALGYQPDEKSWWKKTLSQDDLKIDSPYNTYLHIGLPPAPIANPGLAAIKAVIAADEHTPYWFYLSDKNGKMHYATTIEEHNTNIQKYLQ